MLENLDFNWCELCTFSDENGKAQKTHPCSQCRTNPEVDGTEAGCYFTTHNLYENYYDEDVINIGNANALKIVDKIHEIYCENVAKKDMRKADKMTLNDIVKEIGNCDIAVRKNFPEHLRHDMEPTLFSIGVPDGFCAYRSGVLVNEKENKYSLDMVITKYEFLGNIGYLTVWID